MRGGRLGNLFFATLARNGGLALVPFFLFWVALYFVVAAPAARRVSFDLADRVGRGGSLLRRLRFAFRHFYSFGSMMIEASALFGGRARGFQVEAVGEEEIGRALALGKGAVLVTAHLGSWEAMGHMLARLGTPVSLVMADGVQPELRATMERVNDGRSFQVLHTDGSPTSAAAILAVLARGEIVGVMGDRLFGGRGVSVPFLGGRATFPLGPYVLAAAAEAPVFHVFSVRRGPRRYAFYGFPAGTPDRSDRRTRDAELSRFAGAFAQRLEGFVREVPEQWKNFYPFWDEPKSEPAPARLAEAAR